MNSVLCRQTCNLRSRLPVAFMQKLLTYVKYPFRNRQWLRHYLAKRQRYKELIRASRIVIGAGGTSFPGWTSVELNDLDLTKRRDFLKYWKPASRQAFLAEHVWEHLSIEHGRIGLKNCFEFLQPGGHLRIAVPDGYFPDQSYIDYVKPGGFGAGADDHKVLYNIDTIVPVIESAGFEVRPLEHFTQEGKFVATPFDSDDGYIDRCRANDPRNTEGILRYTSLIVDAIKIE